MILPTVFLKIQLILDSNPPPCTWSFDKKHPKLKPSSLGQITSIVDTENFIYIGTDQSRLVKTKRKKLSTVDSRKVSSTGINNVELFHWSGNIWSVSGTTLCVYSTTKDEIFKRIDNENLYTAWCQYDNHLYLGDKLGKLSVWDMDTLEMIYTEDKTPKKIQSIAVNDYYVWLVC